MGIGETLSGAFCARTHGSEGRRSKFQIQGTQQADQGEVDAGMGPVDRVGVPPLAFHAGWLRVGCSTGSQLASPSRLL